MNALLAERAERVMVVADASRLGRRAFVDVCPPDRIWVLVTDDSASDADVQPFIDLGVAVVRASGRAAFDVLSSVVERQMTSTIDQGAGSRCRCTACDRCEIGLLVRGTTIRPTSEGYRQVTAVIKG